MNKQVERLQEDIQEIVKNDEGQYNGLQTKFAELRYEKEQLALVYQ